MLPLLPGMSLGIESQTTGFIFYSIKRNKCAVLTAHCTLALTYSNFRKDLRLPKNESLSNYLKKRDYKVPCGWSSSSSSPSSTLPAALYALHCVTPLILLLILLDLGSCSSLTLCSPSRMSSVDANVRQIWQTWEPLSDCALCVQCVCRSKAEHCCLKPLFPIVWKYFLKLEPSWNLGCND